MSAKKGDVIYLDGWGGLIGRFVEYNESTKNLVLEFPGDRILASTSEQPFSPVESTQIKVLSANELLDLLVEKIEHGMTKLRTDHMESVSRLNLKLFNY